MLFQRFPNSGKPHRYIVPARVKQRGNIAYFVAIPVASDKHDPAPGFKRFQKSVDDPGRLDRIHRPFNGYGGRKAFRRLVQGNIVNAVPLLGGILVILLKGEISNDPANIAYKRVRSFGRDRVPNGKVRIVYSFF